MKKILSIVLSVMLLLSVFNMTTIAADTGALILEQADALTFSVTRQTDRLFTKTVRSEKSSDIVLLKTMFSHVKEPVGKPDDAQECAKITVESQGLKADYTIYWTKDRYYLYDKGTYRPIDYATFETLPIQLGVYTYRQPPNVSIPSKSNALMLPVKSDGYSYLSMNGAFYKRKIASALTLPIVESSKLIAPDFTCNPDKVSYTVKSDSGKTLWSGTAISEYKPPVSCLVEVTAKYDSPYFHGDAVYSYRIGQADKKKRTGGVPFDHSETDQGEIIVLKVLGGEKVTATTDIDFTPNFFFTDDDTQIALLPVSVYTTPGKHWVDIVQGTTTTRYHFNAKEKKFEVQNLTVAQSTAQQTLLSQQANDEYEQYIAPIRPIADAQKYWNGKFILPVSDQKVTSSFGLIRYVNNAKTPSRHNALDLAVPRGTAVAASGNGRVIFSEYLKLTGNTIVIEHGYGLKSWHYHMDTRNVKTGEMVKQGQTIGTVGSTGFSTGPHLHFSMSVNGVFVNPYTLINNELLED